MKTLPWDCYRCKPAEPTETCEQCLRFKDLPGQSWGPRTPLMTVDKFGDEGCAFVPKYEGDES
jgi:hypothetical protein